jgi:hypothetical protein
LDRAHEAKTSIEQRQRDLVLQRKNSNVAWETKVCRLNASFVNRKNYNIIDSNTLEAWNNQNLL